MTGRLLLEEELRRSCIFTDDSQVDEVADLVMDFAVARPDRRRYH